jgi:ribosomal protein L35
LLRRSANQSHNLEHKSPKQKRAFSKAHAVDPDNAKTVDRMLGRR